MYVQKFMNEAIKQAKRAAKYGETPIGAVIVYNGKIISRGRNKREEKKNSLCHAEIVAINKACKALGAWRLSECDLYVTLEPCPMCSGAIIQSRIKNVYFGAYDYKAGCAGSKTNLFREGMFNHNVNIEGGYSEKECVELLQSFFKVLRERNKKECEKSDFFPKC